MQRNILEYLERTAQLYPDKIAFEDNKEAITFSALLNSAKVISINLQKYTQGKTGHRIAVAVDRTASTLVAFFGVLCSGGCYVPLDIQMPEDRMVSILDDVKPLAIIDGTGRRHLSDNLKDKYKVLDYSELVSCEDESNVKYNEVWRSQSDLDPLYIIFTSGSTGKPKGVCVSHRSVIDFTDWLSNTMNVTSDDVIGNQAPFYFDMAGKDIYLTLKCGCSTHILPHMLFSFTGKLMKVMNEKKITSLFWAAAAVRMVASSGALEKNPPLYVNKVGFGGEALPVRWLTKWQQAVPAAVFMNMYGPTEATIDCLYHIIDREYRDDEVLPMGKPCENKDVFLLDEAYNKINNPNVNGEIVVRGTGLALGYFNDSERTNHSFIQNPLNSFYEDKIYCTGDLAYYGEDGLLYFAGRKDNQIKHQGYRIELGEIESKTNSISGLDVGVCVFDQGRDSIIMFYNGDISEMELAKALSDKVPKYMIPNVFIRLDTLPYNANNKIDRVRLKEEYLNGTYGEF